MNARPISALQLAFLLFAATLAGAAVSHAAADAFSLSRQDRTFISRVVTVSLEAAVLFGITQVRSGGLRVLAVPLAPAYLVEVAAVLCLGLGVQFARFGAMAVERWILGGDGAVALMQLNPAIGVDGAWTAHVVRNLLLAGFIIPVLEELLFRGGIYERLRARHSTLTAMLLTSIAFALCHDDFVFAFVMGLVFNSVYVRTGSLRAAILVHCAVNLASWYPLLGQFLVPQPNDGIRSWSWRLATMVLFGVFSTAYVALASRRPRPPAGAEAAVQPS